ncbi:MAG: phosphoglycerate kinase [Desulfovibrionaceae bacterium]|nr:phosphoglycerate kinase [Desulfovibrionaceae bacterium]
MPIRRMTDMDLNGKRIVIREDLNVPLKNGKISNDKRIRAALPTIQLALKKGAGVIILSHLGRPKEGVFEEEFSLAPVASRLSECLGVHVMLTKDFETAEKVRPGGVVLFENVRSLKGEKANDPKLAAKLAGMGDVYCMDAFATAHRAQASTEGAVRAAKIACAGPLLMAELDAFAKVLDNPKRPLVAVIGGSKVSTKLELLNNLLDRVDRLIVGGGIANTLLAATGHNVAKSLYEPDLIEESKKILDKAEKLNKPIPLMTDVVTAPQLAEGQPTVTCSIDDVPADNMILDIGPKTAEAYGKLLQEAGTIVWNGPVGAFETKPFGEGTKAIAKVMADSKAFVVVGGGDSVSAVESYGLADKMGYISTGGGAFLELFEGKKLPAVAALEECGE